MKSKKQAFWGIFFILGAVLILPAGMGAFPGIEIWSLIWTVLAAALLIHGIVKGSVFCMFFAMAFLAIIYAEPLGITAITPWPILGAALLVSIGFRMIFPVKKGKHMVNVVYTNDDGETIQVDRKEGVETEERYSRADGDYLQFEQVFKSGTKYITSDCLKEVNMECVFSTMEIYLDNAILQGGSATIKLESVFSNVTVYVPRTWAVAESSETVFSKVNYSGQSVPDGRNKLYLEGSCVFGGVRVVYI